MIAQTASHGNLALHKREEDLGPLKGLVRELEKHVYHILLVKASNKVSSDLKGKVRAQGPKYKRIVFGGHIITICHMY